jgi:hypothetical protein
MRVHVCVCACVLKSVCMVILAAKCLCVCAHFRMLNSLPHLACRAEPVPSKVGGILSYLQEWEEHEGSLEYSQLAVLLCIHWAIAVGMGELGALHTKADGKGNGHLEPQTQGFMCRKGTGPLLLGWVT